MNRRVWAAGALVAVFFVSAAAWARVRDVSPGEAARALAAPIDRASRGLSLTEPYEALRERLSRAARTERGVHTVHGTINPRTDSGRVAAEAWPAAGPLPAAALPGPVASAVAQQAGPTVFAVVFDRTPSAAARAAIRAAGGVIVGYLPADTYLVAARSDAVFDRAPGIAHVFAWPAGARVEPSLAAALAKNAWPRSETPLVQVLTYPGFSARATAAVAAAVAALPGKPLPGRDDGVEPYHVSDHPFGPGAATFAVSPDRWAVLVSALARLPQVMWVQIRDIPVTLNSGSSIIMQSGSRLLGSRPLFDRGLTGFGQVYAAVDSGLDTDACQVRYGPAADAQTFQTFTIPPIIEVTKPEGKVIAYYTLPGAQPYDEASGGFHGTATTGCAVGDNYAHLAGPDDPGLDDHDGMAPGAKVVFQDVGDNTGALSGLARSSQTDIHIQSLRSGASVHNDSYGLRNDSTTYDADGRMIDDVLWANPDYSVVFAAGNSGPREGTLGGEGSTAKNTIAVGATLPGWSSGGGDDIVVFSSRGPTADGRLKPDVAAPGIVITASENETITLDGVIDVDGRTAQVSVTDPPNNQCDVTFTLGTSFSSPTAAGMAVLVREYFTAGFYPTGRKTPADARVPTGALVKALMLASSRNVGGDVIGFGRNGNFSLWPVDAAPSTMQGWGRPALDDVLYFDGDREDLRVLADAVNGSDDAIAVGDVRTYEVTLRRAGPLRIALVWLDPGGDPSARRALVNDLDLVVTDPAGVVYRGNVNVVNTESRPAERFTADALNPAEMVVFGNAPAGRVRIAVEGVSVPGNGATTPFDAARQGFALIAVGDFDEDRPAGPAKLSIPYARITGGCDDDDALDLTETAQFSVSTAVTDGDAADGLTLSVNLDAAPGAPIRPEHLEWTGPSVRPLPRIDRKSYVLTDFTVRLRPEAGLELAGKSAVFVVTLRRGAETVVEQRVNVLLDADRRFIGDDNPSPESVRCNPEPVVLKAEPAGGKAGTTVARVTLSGYDFPARATARLGLPGARVETTRVVGPARIELEGVVIPRDATPGTYELAVLDTTAVGTRWKAVPGGFAVTAADPVDPVDADESDDTASDAIDADDVPRADPPTGPTYRNRGCAGGAGAAPLWLAAAAALWLRRRGTRR